MLETFAGFVGLLCMGLAAGIALCVLLMERVGAGTARFYTELMQFLNRALTVPAPALGALGLLAIVVHAVLVFLQRGAGVVFWIDVGAAILGAAAGALTKLGHFPINDQMLTWNPESVPADWMRIRARWSAFHVARTISAVVGFALFLLSISFNH